MNGKGTSCNSPPVEITAPAANIDLAALTSSARSTAN